MKNIRHHLSNEVCQERIRSVKDALYVLNGKWKLPIIIALSTGGPQRFKELQRNVEDITPKILSKELRELELNDFVTRTVYDTKPVTVEYELTNYSDTLQGIIDALSEWGFQHKEHLLANSRKKKVKEPAGA